MKRANREVHPLHAGRPGFLRRSIGVLGRPVLAGLALGLLALGVAAVLGIGGDDTPVGPPGGGTKPDVVLPVIDESELDGLSEQAQIIIRETEACEAVVLQSETDLDKARERMQTECHDPAAQRMAELNGENTTTQSTTAGTESSDPSVPPTTDPQTTGSQTTGAAPATTKP